MTGLYCSSVLFHLSLVLEVGIRQAGSTGGSNLYGTTIVVEGVISRFEVGLYAGGAGQRDMDPSSLSPSQLDDILAYTQKAYGDPDMYS